MKQLIDHIQQSIYGPAYYRELLARPMSFSWKYYVALALLFAMFLTVVSSIPVVPKLHQILRELPSAILAYYPDELTLTINKGFVTSNVEEPYYLPLPEVLRDELVGNRAQAEQSSYDGNRAQAEQSSYDGQMPVNRLFAIDTTEPFNLERFKAHQALIWVGKDFVAYYENDVKIATVAIDPEIAFLLNEQTLTGMLEMIEPYLKFVPPLLVVFFFFGFLMLFAINLVYLFLGALLIFLLGKLMKEHWGYWKSYQIGLHAMTLPLLLNGVLVLFTLGITGIPFVYTVVMLAIVYINFVHSKLAALASENITEKTPPA